MIQKMMRKMKNGNGLAKRGGLCSRETSDLKHGQSVLFHVLIIVIRSIDHNDLQPGGWRRDAGVGWLIEIACGEDRVHGESPASALVAGPVNALDAGIVASRLRNLAGSEKLNR